MSEVIEEFIRTHSDLPEREAFETFLGQDRIKTWVGQDPARRDRLQREFSRVWGTLQGASASSQAPVAAAVQRPPAHAPPPPPPPPAPREAPPPEPAPARESPRPTRVQVRHERPAPPAPASRPMGASSSVSTATRRLNLLCPACARLDVWLQDGEISCHGCARVYDDMLALVPVKPVGPFEYVFGEGPMGYVKAAGVGTLLLLVYGVLKWL